MYRRMTIIWLSIIMVLMPMVGISGSLITEVTALEPAASEAATEDALTISYAEAMSWIETLPVEQREDQIRDYALLGMASRLGLDIGQMRDALYDRSPARDPLFRDLASDQIGTGRSLYDGVDTLYVLVPESDPYEARTLGLTLDDHRKNAGADAEYVSVHRYSIDQDGRVIHVQPVRTQAVSELRGDYGYVEMSISDSDDVFRFLARTQHLSQVKVEDGELVAGGWNWPGVPTGRVTIEDLAVLQDGYLAARGEPITVEQFLTEYDTSRLDIDIQIPSAARANASQLDAFFSSLSRAETNADFADFLDEHQQLILDVVLDQDTAAELEAARAGMREDEWLYELSVALGNEFENNELWGVLAYVADEPFYVPADDATEPGFSLDPAPVPTLEELVDTLSASHYRDLRGYEDEIMDFMTILQMPDDAGAFWAFVDEHEDFILNAVLSGPDTTRARRLLSAAGNARTNESYAAAYDAYAELIFSAIGDGERPWQLLLYTADGKPPYQYARYDGGLAGTESGMTYFYTDVLAKGLFYELGEGSPYGIVDGFVSKVHSSVPWSHCTQEEEQGRIWFGLNEDAIGLSEDTVNLGSVATRVFVSTTDPIDGEREIEPSYMFGQGVWWWDQHYMDMADHEPQYHRLDQLMRWGAAIGWLVEQDEALLPTSPAATVKSDWRFDEWLSQQSDLTWEYDIPFVEVEGIKTETLLRLYSEPYAACGRSWVSSGGISNPSLHRLAEILDSQPQLPPTVSRAGLGRAGTDYARDSDAGTIVTLDGIRRNLRPVQRDRADVEVVAPGRKVWSLGEVKVAVPESAERLVASSISDAGGQLRWSTSVHDVPLGEVSVRSDGQTVHIEWQAGPLANAKTAMDQLQSLLVDYPLQDAIELAFAAGDVYSGASGFEYAVCINGSVAGECAGDNAWMVIVPEPPADDAELHFRLAQPRHDADSTENEITWYYVSMPDSLPAGFDEQ